PYKGVPLKITSPFPADCYLSLDKGIVLRGEKISTWIALELYPNYKFTCFTICYFFWRDIYKNLWCCVSDLTSVLKLTSKTLAILGNWKLQKKGSRSILKRRLKIRPRFVGSVSFGTPLTPFCIII
ncbi:hypothetical protein Avbf_09327, partial [Armadillidium vulgare]